MRKRLMKAKREKFPIILLKSLAVVCIISAVFAVGFREVLNETMRLQAKTEIEERMSELQRSIDKIESESESEEECFRQINARLAMYTHFSIQLDDPIFDPNDQRAVQLVPEYTDKCHAAGVLLDEDSNVAASNRRILMVYLMFEQDKESDIYRDYYLCDNEALGLPEADELYETFSELDGTDRLKSSIELELDSIYVNREKRTFIPHKGTMTKWTYKTEPSFFLMNDAPYLVEDEEIEKTETKEISIDIDDDSYELIEIHRGVSNKQNPRYALLGFYGAEKEIVDSAANDHKYMNKNNYTSYSQQTNADGTVTFERNMFSYIYKKQYMLSLTFTVNFRDPQVTRMYLRYVISLTLLLLVTALLYSWRRSVANKMKYAMEDYQRDLTDNLAHDIKTPLMAIGGYAENILEGSLSDEEKQQYLNSILDNVAFTDSMISRTLQLNTMDSRSRQKRENLSVEKLLDEAVKKYALILDEKNVTFTVKGSASVSCERSSLEAVIGNLVSNAVKYTSENGSIKAEADKKRLVITNTVAERIDTKKLKQPFVRGDDARSNTKGSGLGLSIADRAAMRCGMTLKISCSDSEFRAELKF